MPDAQILWTALPRAATPQHLDLDVFVSPRLGVDANESRYQLSEFPEWEHWPKTLEAMVSFTVEFADGTTHAAQRMTPPPLEHSAWGSLFPPTSLVRPWSFKDLSDRPIYSPPLRFVTGYLRDRYRDTGHAHPIDPPGPDGLGKLTGDLGPLTDVRVGDERRPPNRDNADLPLPHDPTPPPADRQGCIGFLWRLLRWLINLIRLLLGLPPLPKPKPLLHDPTRPKVPIPRVVHPSPYEPPSPLNPVVPQPLATLEQQMQTNKVAPPQLQHFGDMKTALAQRDPTLDFARVLRFYERPESEPPKTGGIDPNMVRPRPDIPEFDFHQALGAIGDYPELLRRLGLVIRLRIPRPPNPPQSIRVIPAWNGSIRPAQDIAPMTRCTLTGTGFHADAQPDSDIVEGMLDLAGTSDSLTSDTPKFDVIQVDADGAALKAILAAATIERRRQLLAAKLYGFELPIDEPLPALRSGGLAVIRPDRAYWVHQHLLNSSALKVPVPTAPGQPQTLAADLQAEDLVRGYRVEVSTDGGTNWRSLCQRIGDYRILHADGTDAWTLPNHSDHGYVKAASTTSEPGEAQPLYLHEALLRWTGWSLTVPRPGRTIGRTQQVEAPSTKAATDFRLEARFRPQPGTLPRLRFGHDYRLRIACIDLAGEPLAAPTAASPNSDDVTFRRFEPLEPPALLPLRRYLPGESLERLVIRSNFNTDTHSYETNLGETQTNARAQRTRHVFPPKTSQLQAELHGHLDDAFGPTGNPDTGYRISLREAGTFRDPKIIDIHTVDIHHPQATIPFGTPTEIPPNAVPAPPDPPQGAYVVNLADITLITPYLPDPIAAGVALRGLPGLTTHVDGDQGAVHIHQLANASIPGGAEPLLQVPFTGSWPDIHSIRLRLGERTATHLAPHWDAAERLLTIYLGKSDRAEIRYSTYLTATALEQHGLWNWLDAPPGTTLHSQAKAGAHWMISPPRTLVAVHALQQPLEAAHLSNGDANARKVDETSAPIRGDLHIHPASTSRIDLIGTWDEWRDELLDATPWPQPPTDGREAVAFDLAVEENWPSNAPFPPPGLEQRARHEFGDTKHRTVHYRIRATTRFRDYLPENVAGPTGSGLWRDSDTSDIATVNIPSSARPATPNVLYIVPAFGWKGTQTVNWTTAKHERVGGGLRVYLDRPWYSSGEGELLGVLIAADEPNPPPDELCTRYGRDPISGTGGNQLPSTTTLHPHHFPNRIAEKTTIQLAERSDVSATVVGFKPEYDPTRKLWFCDIEIATDDLDWNYWPFIRLALVRYQPDSLDGAHVSPVILGEFAQLAPNRELTVNWQGNQKLTATLRGRGPTQRIEPRVAYLIEATDSAIPTPDELDWTWAAGAPPSVDEDSFPTLVAPTDPADDGIFEWTQQIDLPFARHTKPMRLAVREYEYLRIDSTAPASNGQTGRDLRGIPRITYAATIPLG